MTETEYILYYKKCGLLLVLWFSCCLRLFFNNQFTCWGSQIIQINIHSCLFGAGIHREKKHFSIWSIVPIQEVTASWKRDAYLDNIMSAESLVILKNMFGKRRCCTQTNIPPSLSGWGAVTAAMALCDANIETCRPTGEPVCCHGKQLTCVCVATLEGLIHINVDSHIADTGS